MQILNGNDSGNQFLASKFAENYDFFLRKWQKNHFFGQKGQKNFGQPTTRNFELKMLKLLKNHLRQMSRMGFLIFFN